MTFICNIYNPEAEDAEIILISALADESKRKILFKFLKDQLKEVAMGEPKATVKTSAPSLKKRNFVGLYAIETTPRSVISYFKPIDKDAKKEYHRQNRNKPAINEVEEFFGSMADYTID